MNFIKPVSDGVVLSVHVVPNAKKEQVAGVWNNEAVKIALSAPPADNRANERLIEFLSESLKKPKKNFSLILGLKNRDKRVKISGNTEELDKEIQEWLQHKSSTVKK